MTSFKDYCDNTPRIERGDLNALIVGPTGSGKTFSLKTAPRPMIIHSFDPSGCATIRSEIGKESGIWVDSQFEEDSVTNPWVFRTWLSTFENMQASGIFNEIKTFAIDSLTLFQRAAMKEVLRVDDLKNPKKGKLAKGCVPQRDDYAPVTGKVSTSIEQCLALPCNFILTAHVTVKENEVDISGGRLNTLAAYGQLRTLFPALFSEVYGMLSNGKTDSNRINYFQTQKDDTFNACSRLSGNGLLNFKEEADFTKIIEKTRRKK